MTNHSDTDVRLAPWWETTLRVSYVQVTYIQSQVGQSECSSESNEFLINIVTLNYTGPASDNCEFLCICWYQTLITTGLQSLIMCFSQLWVYDNYTRSYGTAHHRNTAFSLDASLCVGAYLYLIVPGLIPALSWLPLPVYGSRCGMWCTGLPPL